MNSKNTSLTVLASLGLACPLLALPVPVTITLNNDVDLPAYVTKADDANLYSSQFEDGSAARPTSFANIKEISWRQPDDWEVAMDLWNRRDYAEATAAFAKAAEDYKGLAASKHPLMKDSIGAQAVYYYVECLRRRGKFDAMMKPFVRLRNLNLGTKWQDQIRLYQGWAHVASKSWGPLSLLMKSYALANEEIPGVGDYTVAPNEPPIKIEINVHQMAQIAYMRGIATDNLADKVAADLDSLDPTAEATREDREALAVQLVQMRSQALTDYARAMTVNYGAERGLALRSMLAMMRLLQKDPNFNDNYPAQKEAHGIAILFNALSPGSMPVSLKPLLTPPVDPDAGEGAE